MAWLTLAKFWANLSSQFTIIGVFAFAALLQIGLWGWFILWMLGRF